MGQTLEDRFKVPHGAKAIAERIEQLEEARQKRLQEIAQNDPVWAQLGGQIESLNWCSNTVDENGNGADDND